MECRQLEITLISGKDLKDVNLITKMDVYAVVSVKGDPLYPSQKQRTPVHKDSGPSPRWDHSMFFSVHDDSLQRNRLSLNIDLFSDRSLGDRLIGEVHVPLKDLLDQTSPSPKSFVDYAVRTPSGKPRGSIHFSFKFSDKTPADKLKAASAPPVAYPASTLKAASDPPVAYPAANLKAASDPPIAYPAYAAAGSSAPPPSQPYPYPYPPQQPVYGGYPPQPGYGYPPHGYAPPQGYYGGYQAQPPKKNNGGKMALGIGAGLLGGLLIGDMVSDVGEMAAYDAGFDDGFGF